MTRGSDTLGGMRSWTARHWLVALLAGLGTVVLVAVPTDLLDTPLFGRSIAPTWWAWPVLLATAVLGGLLAATYVALPAAGPGPGEGGAARMGTAGGLVTFFAVGCPVCNKVVLLALGASGAVRWFAPVQPLLGVLALGLLGWALRRRLVAAGSCPTPG